MKKVILEAQQLLRETGVENPRVEVTKDPRYGEVSSSVAFELAKKLKKPPLEIAEEIVSRIDFSRANVITVAEVAKPGYINFKINWKLFAQDILDDVLKNGRAYGFPNIGAGKHVLIEHTSVNPNKALHIGHARNTCLGDTLYRLFKRLGYSVVIANYIDDSGNQMADLHIAFKKLGYSLSPPQGERFDEYCGRIYAEVNKIIENNADLLQEKRRVIAELENVGSETFKFNREIVDLVLKDQLSTCWRLGARYDILNRESDVLAFNLWSEVFESLKERGLVYYAEEGPKKGCWLISLSEHPVLSKEGDEVLVKSDGTTTYVARDIAYAAWKLGILRRDFKYNRWGKNPDGSYILITEMDGKVSFPIGKASLVVNVIDSRQKRPQAIVKYAVEKLGGGGGSYIHFAYEVVSLSKRDAEKLGISTGGRFVQMSGREGIYINVEPVINLLKERAKEEILKRHRDWSREKIEDVSEKIAVATIRYELLKSDAEKMIIFDSEEASKLEGDTGPYLLYSYVRAARILEKASIKEFTTTPYNEELEEAEKNLIRKIAYMPLIMEEVANLLLIKRIASYANELAKMFNDFYEKCPVIGSKENIMQFRLALVKAFKQVFENVCSVLGLPLPEEM